MSYLGTAVRLGRSAYAGAKFVRSAARRLVKYRKPALKAYTRVAKPWLKSIGASRTFSKYGKGFARGVRRIKRYL